MRRRSGGRRGPMAPTVVVAVVIGSLLAHGPSAAAARAVCRVTNARTNETVAGRGRNLQDAIDNARPGDTLLVTGTCVGTFVVGTKLRLLGVPTTRFPLPALDARDRGRVLTTEAAVRIHGLTIRNGRAHQGGGVRHSGGKLTLGGHSLVARNRASLGGGIYVNTGRVVLTDGAVVRRNVADFGGGIWSQSDEGVVLKEMSVVRANRARDNGGGIFSNVSYIQMGGHSSVRANVAGTFGGGIADFDGFTKLRGHARIVHNSAVREGGGYYSIFANLRVCSKHVVLSPNDPNDAPDRPVADC
jgi:hypothetical protein